MVLRKKIAQPPSPKKDISSTQYDGPQEIWNFPSP